ncbi:MAG: glutaredoxin domain-containing protein [Patescibacteria group bacterium]
MSIFIYSTPTCPYCKQAKEYLAEKKIPFQEINVADDLGKQREMIEKSGQLGVPVIDINGTIIIGFDKAKIDRALGL